MVLIVAIVVIVLAFAPAYLRAYQLTPSGVSEVPTLLPRDIIIVNHAAYYLRFPYSSVVLFRIGSPKRGEMVLIKLPDGRGVAPKRIIGLPGDMIELQENHLVIDGRSVLGKPMNHSEFSWVPQEDKMGSAIEDENGHWITYTPGKGEHRNYPPTKLTSAQYFVLGDNRDESADSRDWGPISEASILGKVMMKFPMGRRQ
jgi:signal peptidase I